MVNLDRALAESEVRGLEIAVIYSATACCRTRCFDAFYYALKFSRTRTLAWLQRLLACAPQDKETAYAVFQCQAVFKKREDIDLGVDKEAVALRAFWASEEVCRVTNTALRNPDDPYYKDRATLIFKMSRKISALLGAVPKLDSLRFGFGPGVNVGCSEYTNVSHKLTVDATGTVGAFRLLRRVFGSEFPVWPGLSKARAVRGSRFTTVPKDWKTDRGIAVEPLVNSFLQKGFGSLIRDRLRVAGIDLLDQSVNQRLARKGSIDGSLATIDLSMASDTIASLLVLDLLPVDWFELLDSCRSPEVLITSDGGDVYHELEKFSSMGNGYTFELESLIFWAACSVACEDLDNPVISVYGDDLIVPASHYDRVLSVLRLLGFVPNPDKSFGSGPFRESCGADFWEGINVRPFFIRGNMDFSLLTKLHNFCFNTGRLPSIAGFIKRHVVTHYGFSGLWFGPAGKGDGHFASDLLSEEVDKRGWGTFTRYRTFISRPFRAPPSSCELAGFLYSRLYNDLGDMLYSDVGRITRSHVTKYRQVTLMSYCHFGN